MSCMYPPLHLLTASGQLLSVCGLVTASNGHRLHYRKACCFNNCKKGGEDSWIVSLLACRLLGAISGLDSRSPQAQALIARFAE